MNKLKAIIISLIITGNIATAQEKIKTDTLKDVIVSSSRIDIPFSKNSRTIQIVNNQDIKNSGTTNVADLLQQVAGVDVRRRGTSGMQADLYVRGGSFDQTLLLIDGIKVEDSQTGHHTMNLALPIEVIERIEIIKGPAARIFGQNAFSGAVNIVTKNANKNATIIEAQAGNYAQKNLAITAIQDLEKSSHIVHVSRMVSDGYRYNTDYDNQNYFIKSSIKTNNAPIEILGTYNNRKFGANGFYASPAAINQYEETQGSLVGVQTKFEKSNLTFKPRVYWRRNQDLYLFKRENPDYYRNLHITNKVGAELNASYKSKFGVTGFGIDMSKVFIVSNNLGNYNRFMTTVFVEQQIKLLDEKLDITPGFAVNYFSDFKFHFFPGIDIGYQLSDNIRTYANVGKTYRIPTYTDLNYFSPTSIGNPNLDPEDALSEEIGIKATFGNFNFALAGFNRFSSKFIDYVKTTASDPYKPQIVENVTVHGFETQVAYSYKMKSFPQKLQLGYTFIENKTDDRNVYISDYTNNTAKHQFTSQYTSQFIKNLKQTISFRYIERISGNSYSLIDANINYTLKSFEISIVANNIFNKEYTEQNFIPMPKGNMLFGLKYNFR